MIQNTLYHRFCAARSDTRSIFAKHRNDNISNILIDDTVPAPPDPYSINAPARQRKT